MNFLDQEQQRLKAEMDERKARWPFPGGWRADTQPTQREKRAEEALLERQRRKADRVAWPTRSFNGEEFAKRSYVRRLADILYGPPHPFTSNADLMAFLRSNKRVKRTRSSGTIYYHVEQFSKEWRKRLTRLNRTTKARKSN